MKLYFQGVGVIYTFEVETAARDMAADWLAAQTPACYKIPDCF